MGGRSDAFYECFVLLIRTEIIRQLELILKPGSNDLFEQNTIKISTATHCNTAVAQETYAPGDALGHSYVKRSSTQIIDNKNTIGPSSPHNAHNSRDWLLHQRDLTNAGLVSGRHRRVFLHLIECRRDSYNCACVFVITDGIW